MEKFCKSVSFLFIFCLLNSPFLFALETPTHELINEFILDENVGFPLSSYLKKRLNFPDGIEEKFRAERGSVKYEETKTVEDWIKEGGEWEDLPPKTLPYIRSFNHYHDPLTMLGYNILGVELGESALQWAQEPPGTQWIGGYYSWYDIREYFYNTLTSS